MCSHFFFFLSSSKQEEEEEKYRSVVGRLGGGNFNISSFPTRAIDGEEGEELLLLLCGNRRGWY